VTQISSCPRGRRLRRGPHEREGCSENLGCDFLEDFDPNGVLQGHLLFHTCAHDHAVGTCTEKDETTDQHSAYLGSHSLPKVRVITTTGWTNGL
jgi:hypothetical protein